MTAVSHQLLKALDLQHNKMVQACAGAGKTFALTKRYCAILDAFASQNRNIPAGKYLGPENILVITFTNQAAAEMAERIYKDLNLLLKGNEISPFKEAGIVFGKHLRDASLEYKNQLRSAFSGNSISTIDSFCAKTLRSYAHEADLDPKFKVGDEIIGRQILDDTLFNFLQEKGKQFNTHLETLFRNTSPANISDFFIYIYNNRAFLDPWLNQWKQLLDQGNEASVKQQWLNNYTPNFNISKVLHGISQLLGYSVSELKDTSDSGFLFLEELKQYYHQFPGDHSKIEQRRFLLLKPLKLFLKKDGLYRKIIPGNASYWKVKDRLKEIKASCLNFIEELKHICPPEFFEQVPTEDDFRAIPVIQSLVHLYLEFEKQMEQVKSKQNYLEFNDVIIKTRDLLKSNPKIREKLHKKYPHILVDEFQDTNDLRWEIIKLLATDEEDKLRPKGLFIVGDRKQSIYRFNQADVGVMNRVMTDLLNRDPKRKENTVIDFNDNYRASNNYITKVINYIFPKLMPSEQSMDIQPYDAWFEPTRFPEENASSAQVAAQTAVCCNINIAINEDAGFNEYLPALNAAETISELLKWAEKNKLTQSGKPVIGVLLRNFTHIQEYLSVFRQQKIPFEIISGKNLFQQQEAYDLFHLISVLINPHDDLALIGLLRSPFFMMSDSYIDKCCERNTSDQQSIFQFMKSSNGFSAFTETIKSWIQQSRILPVNELISRILFDQERLFGYYSETDAPQRIANLEKLIFMLEDLSKDGASLHSIHEILKYRMEESIQAAQADMPSSALVQIMTIHKSKGLEFPAVVLPELNGRSNPDKSVIMHGKIPVNTDTKKHNTNIEVGITLSDEEDESQKTNLLSYIKTISKKEQEAEEIRLFYVAVTRARYRVALLADFDQIKLKKNNTWWGKFIYDTYRFSDAEQEIPQPPNNFTQINVHTAEELLKKRGSKSTVSADFTPLPERLSFPEYGEVTPHTLMENNLLISSDAGDSTPGKTHTHGTIFGSFFHRIMERELWDFEEQKKPILQLLDNEFSELPRKESLKEVQVQLNLFHQSDLYTVLSKLPAEDKFMEKPVSGWINNGSVYLKVSGIIDLLFIHHGQWFVVDYKTDQDESRLDAYKIQIQTYLWILKQMYNIEATGKIYYSVSGKTVDIQWEENYFSRIYPEYKDPFKLTPFFNTGIHPRMLELVQKADNPVIIINPTRHHSSRLLQALSVHHILKPSTQITTLQELIQNYPILGRNLSPHQQRLMIRKLLSENNQETKPGVISLINEAVTLHEEWDCALESPFTDIPEKLAKLKKEGNWYSDGDIMRKMIEACNFSGKTVILNGFYLFTPLHFKLVRKISRSAKDFYFINNFKEGRVDRHFEYDDAIWHTFLSSQNMEGFRSLECEICFSLQHEVERVARHIKATPNFADNFDAIKVSVSSVKKYLPVIKQIFGQFNLPFRTAIRQPVMHHPFARWLLSVMELLNSADNISWDKISSVFLHPLANPSPERYTFDKWIRKTGLLSWKAIHSFKEDPEIPEMIKNQISEVSLFLENIISTSERKNMFRIKEQLFKVFTFFQIKEKLEKDIDSNGIFNKICNIINNIPLSFKLIDLPGDAVNFSTELKEQLMTTEYLHKKQQVGIEILGFMDTIDIQSEYLYILGLNEGDFPVRPPVNPFVEKFSLNPWPMNIMLFQKMLMHNGKVKFFAPLRNNQGEYLQLSTFLEYLTVTEQNRLQSIALPVQTVKEYFSTFYGKMIKNPENDLRLLRHNQYLANLDLNKPSPYLGFTNPRKRNQLHISPYRMDDLLKCPMRYWYSSILFLEETDPDPHKKKLIRSGKIIHKALEIFGKENGFEINKTHPEEACARLENDLKNALKENHVDISEDIQTRFEFRNFTEGLAEGDENNLLVKLLTRHRNEWKVFKAIFFEKKFRDTGSENPGDWGPLTISNGRLTITFSGIIDKILVSPDGPVLGTDYKTGNIKNQSDITGFWTSQLIIYYLLLKQQYANHPVLLAYEQLKSKKAKENGVLYYLGDTDTPELETIQDTKTAKNVLIAETESEGKNIIDIKKIKHEFFNLAQKTVEGHFHLTTRDRKKACEYCPYEKICRKDSV